MGFSFTKALGSVITCKQTKSDKADFRREGDARWAVFFLGMQQVSWRRHTSSRWSRLIYAHYGLLRAYAGGEACLWHVSFFFLRSFYVVIQCLPPVTGGSVLEMFVIPIKRTFKDGYIKLRSERVLLQPFLCPPPFFFNVASLLKQMKQRSAQSRGLPDMFITSPFFSL